MLSKYFKYKNIIDQIPQPLNVEEYNSGASGTHWYLSTKNNGLTYTIDDFFTKQEIAEILAVGKVTKSQRGLTQDNSNDYLDYRRTIISWININQHTEWIYRKLTDAVIEANNNQFEYDIECIESLQFTKYSYLEEGEHDKHVDPIIWNLPTNRKLTFVLQLSDPTEYEGGDLILWNSRNPKTMEKKLGRIIFFPSNVLHQVTPVTVGYRYTIVGWVHGPVFK
jgi:PKHD-type hydroxylase